MIFPDRGNFHAGINSAPVPSIEISSLAGAIAAVVSWSVIAGADAHLDCTVRNASGVGQPIGSCDGCAGRKSLRIRVAQGALQDSG